MSSNNASRNQYLPTICIACSISFFFAAVSTTQSKAKYAEVLGWIFRRMQTVDAKTGAIVLYYSTKAELVNDEEEKWIDKLKETIRFNNLPITVEVLPAFE